MRWLHDQLGRAGPRPLGRLGRPASERRVVERDRVRPSKGPTRSCSSSAPIRCTRECAREELEHAGAFNKRIVPVVCRDPGDVPVPDLVAARNWIFCRRPDEQRRGRRARSPRPSTPTSTGSRRTRASWCGRGSGRANDESRALVAARRRSQPGGSGSRGARRRPARAHRTCSAAIVLASRQGATRRLRTAMLIVARRCRRHRRPRSARGHPGARRQRDRAARVSRRLAADADAQLDTDPQLSLLARARRPTTRVRRSKPRAAVRQATLENRERAVLHGHHDEVSGVAVSPDGTHLATSSFDHTARVWDLRHLDDEPVVLSGHTNAVNGIAFSPDGTRVATASDDHTARVWDWQHPDTPPVVLHHDDVVFDVAFSPDGAVRRDRGRGRHRAGVGLAAPGRAGRGAPRERHRLRGRVQPRRHVASRPVLSDNTAHVWDWRHPETPPIVLAGHTALVHSVAFSPDGARLATASFDGTARVWDWQHTGRRAPTTLTGHTAALEGVTFSPDGARVATTSIDQTDARVGVAASRGRTDGAARPDGQGVGGGVQPRRHACGHGRRRPDRRALGRRARRRRSGPTPRARRPRYAPPRSARMVRCSRPATTKPPACGNGAIPTPRRSSSADTPAASSTSRSARRAGISRPPATTTPRAVWDLRRPAGDSDGAPRRRRHGAQRRLQP